jgi:hypothetical protein
MADLMNHLIETRHPELKRTCEHNRDLLLTWARAGFKDERPKTEYVYPGAGEKGTDLITKKPQGGTGGWTKRNRRIENAPEQTPLSYPSEQYMSKIRGLWDKGTPLLQDILRNPNKIREQPGADLKAINKEIESLKAEYIKSLENKEEAGGIPDLEIPAGLVLLAVVGVTERAIQQESLDLEDDHEVRKAETMIKEYVQRAKQGDGWIENMVEAFRRHTDTASTLWAQGADSLVKIHAHEEFWDADLLGWIRDNYMASAPRQEAGPEWKSAENASEPDSDSMSISFGEISDRMSISSENKPVVEGPPQSDSGRISSENNMAPQHPGIQDSNSAGHPIVHAAAAEQSQASEVSANVSGSSLSAADRYTVNYGGENRFIHGYKHCGGGNKFSVLIAVKGKEYGHMIASSDVDGDAREPIAYLENGGYLVGDVENDKKQLEIGVSIEGTRKHVEGHRFRDFEMSAYAVGARDPNSTATRSIHQYIKGRFKEEEAVWYTKSKFCRIGNFREKAVQKMIEGFRKKHNIGPEDDVKLSDRHVEDSNGETIGSEDTGDELDGFVVSDGPPGQNGKVSLSSTSDPFGFLNKKVSLPNSLAGNTTGNTGNREMEMMKTDILNQLIKEFQPQFTGLQAQQTKMIAMLESLAVTPHN